MGVGYVGVKEDVGYMGVQEGVGYVGVYDAGPRESTFLERIQQKRGHNDGAGTMIQQQQTTATPC